MFSCPTDHVVSAEISQPTGNQLVAQHHLQLMPKHCGGAKVGTYITITPSGAENHGDCPVVRISMAQKSCFAFGGDQLDVIYYELLKPSDEVITDVAPSADFHLTHLAQWHTAWMTSTSVRMKSEVKNWIDS
nr:hypothetical protein HmN_000481200 [Hymenolepis microstoma]